MFQFALLVRHKCLMFERVYTPHYLYADVSQLLHNVNTSNLTITSHVFVINP